MNAFRSVVVGLGAGLLAMTVCSIETLAQAEENGNFQAGISAYQSNNLSLAYKEFLVAAQAGHADSQFNVALMYEQGIGIGKDEKEAIVWYRKAAEQQHAAAQYNLAVLYENGRGTEIDFAMANEWYRKAAAQGDPLAMGNLGMLYVRGQGVTENKVAGVALLMVSATLDPSPENRAKQNLAATRGLTSDMIVAAQALSQKFSQAGNLLVPLDEYLELAKNGPRNQ
jgi:TPR repeat protein